MRTDGYEQVDPDAATEPVDRDRSLRDRSKRISDGNSTRGSRSHAGGDRSVLWSYATAQEIAELIIEDIAAERIDRARGDDLIGRVWDRAGPR